MIFHLTSPICYLVSSFSSLSSSLAFSSYSSCVSPPCGDSITVGWAIIKCGRRWLRSHDPGEGSSGQLTSPWWITRIPFFLSLLLSLGDPLSLSCPHPPPSSNLPSLLPLYKHQNWRRCYVYHGYALFWCILVKSCSTWHAQITFAIFLVI